MRTVRIVAIFIFCVSIGTHSGAEARTSTDREVSRAEAEWAKAQQDYYEALKREPDAQPTRKKELEQEFLAPKREALKRAHRKSQAGPKQEKARKREPKKKSPRVPLRNSKGVAVKPSSEPESDSTDLQAIENGEGPSPEPSPSVSAPPSPIVEFGRGTTSAPPARPPRFEIDEVPQDEAPTEFRSRGR